MGGRVLLLDELLPQFASRLTRTHDTIGGNLGTGPWPVLHGLPHQHPCRPRGPHPAAARDTTSFHKVAKRRYDHISVVAFAFALEFDGGVVREVCIASAVSPPSR